MGVQNGFCCGKPTQPCHLEHLEPMSAKHLEEEPSSRKSKPWRLFQSLTCVIVTSNASELPWDDGDNKIVWWSTEVSSSNNCFIPFWYSPWTTKFIVAICSQLGKLKLRIQWLLQTTPKNIPKGTECYTWCCVKRHWWAKKRSQKTPVKRVARQTVKPNPKNWGLFWEMECTQNPIRRMVLLNPSHLETSTQSFVQPRCNIQGHGMSLLKCCTEDMTLYSDTSQGDVYM